MSFKMRRLDAAQADFNAQMDELLAWEGVSDAQVQQTVTQIVNDVRQNGDAALIEYTNKLDRTQVNSISELELTQEQLQQALDGLDEEQRNALLIAAERVRSYHENSSKNHGATKKPMAQCLVRKLPHSIE